MPSHTGRVLPGKHGTVDVMIVDRLGCVVRLVGHRDTAGGGYFLKATSIEYPPHLRVPLIDEGA